jgi:tRNA A-37 threonylcarbamoyl transferase component Bud32
VESRGVDLNLMYRMLISTHYEHTEELFTAFKAGYEETLGEAREALERMDAISKRGRYVERE